MPFISNASNFTLGEGVYNNIHGNVNIAVREAFYRRKHHRGLVYGRKRHREEIEEPLRKGRRREDGIKVIRKKHLKVTGEIGSGPGYLLHFGETKDKAIIVKVFHAGPTVREQLESTIALSKGLLHPNVLRIEGVSSPVELTQFIIYEHAYWKMAEGPLATALKEDLTRSITLGFKMIAGLSSGMNYLGLQGISLASLGAENFDIFLDVDDRFLISINPRISTETEVAEDQEPEDNMNRSWNVFIAVCQKVLKSANLALHNESIERDPVALESQASVAQHPLRPSVPVSAPAVESSSAQIISDSVGISVPPRREYVWRTIDRGQQSLATVARRIAWEIDMKLTSSVNKLAWSDARSVHRCAGYVREEITLATTSVDSAVVSHDAPSPSEICSICREVVGFHEQFRCICGVLDSGSRPTVKCVACKFWSHSDCVGNPKEFTCEPCLPPPGVSSPINSPVMEEEQTRRLYEEEDWISNFIDSIVGKKARQADLSKTVSAQWRALPAEERAKWEDLARERKKEHAERSVSTSGLADAPGDQPGTLSQGTSSKEKQDAKKFRAVGSAAGRRAAKNRRKDQMPGAFVCEVCGADFTAKHNLRNHMNSHGFVKEFRCDTCGQFFGTSHVLKRHEGKCLTTTGTFPQGSF